MIFRMSCKKCNSLESIFLEMFPGCSSADVITKVICAPLTHHEDSRKKKNIQSGQFETLPTNLLVSFFTIDKYNTREGEKCPNILTAAMCKTVACTLHGATLTRVPILIQKCNFQRSLKGSWRWWQAGRWDTLLTSCPPQGLLLLGNERHKLIGSSSS